MAEAELPQVLRARLREYFRYRRSVRSLHDCPALLQAMSPALRAQVASHTQAKWVNTVPFFRPLPEYLKTEIALALRTEAYAPNEPIVREGDKCDRLFIVDQGLLSSKGRLLGCGALVGEQHFLLDKGRWSHSANTVTYTRLLTLDKATFDEMLLRYPVAKKSIRKHAIRSALREHLVCYTLALEHVRRNMGMPYQPTLLPSKEEIRGSHLSQEKYHRILQLVAEAEPTALQPLEAAAVVIQKFWRGLKARRLRKALEHATRIAVIQYRAARYHTELDTSASKQTTIAVRSFRQDKWYTSPTDLASCGRTHQVQHSPVEQHLLHAAEGTEQTHWGLVPAIGPESAHSKLADSEIALGTEEVATASATPDIQKHGSVHIQSMALSSGLSDSHDNVLFEGPWSEQGNSGLDSQEANHGFQRQLEDGLRSMQLELQRFKADVLTQLHALQLANAGKPGARARPHKGNIR